MSIFKLISAAAVASTIGLSASAATVSGPQTTAGGKTVNLSGLEWLTWDVTQGTSRSQIEAGAGGWLAAGWRYATRTEFETLFDSLWGGISEGWSSSNGDGASWVRKNFNQNFGSYNFYANTLFGADGECNANTSVSCRSHYASQNNYGWFADFYGLSDGVSPGNSASYASKNHTWSSALVRDVAPVPLPAAGLLLVGALGGLGLMRRRRKA